MRVLFCPLASHGFVYPMIGMARLLERHGHATAFVTDQSFGQELKRHGCLRIPRSATRDGASFGVSEWANPTWTAIQVKHLEHALGCFQPDLIIGQPLTLGALIVGERTELPIALLGFCTYHWPRSREVLENPSSEPERRLGWRFREWTALYNEARKLFRLPPVGVDILDTSALGDLLLVRSIPGFGVGDDGVPSRAAFVGDCLWEPHTRIRELESWLSRAQESGRPLVYLQQGRFVDFPDFWPSFKAVARKQDLWVAVSTSRMSCDMGEMSPNWLARPFLPQEQILRRADLLVTAGNTTAVLGAVRAGVPGLLIPAGGEQPDVAAWCDQAGLAKVLSPPETVTAETILAGVQQVLENPSYRHHARLMQSRFTPYRGFRRAVSAVEALWRRASMVPRMASR